MLWLLKHLETNWDIFRCADPVLRQEIARSSGLSVTKEFINCCQDSCTHMLFARTHNGYALSNMEMDGVVLSSLALVCNFERSLEEGLRCEKLMCAKTWMDKTETFHRLNPLIWKRRLIRGFLDYLYELYRLEISSWCVQHTQIGWYIPKER